MVNYNKLADFYHKRLSGISKEDHLMIIMGALGGENPAMNKSGFTKWYNKIGEKLQRKNSLIDYIRTNPHFIMYRETMIHGGDWIGIPISRMVLL